MKKRISIFLVICLIFISLIAVLVINNKKMDNNLSYVIMDINPSIMLGIDSKENVVEVVPLNNDANVLLSNTNLVGMNLKEANEKILNDLTEMGYIDEYSDINTVMVEVISNLENVRQQLEEKVLTNVTDFGNDKQINIFAAARGLTQELKDEAVTNNISYGKMLLVSRALDLNSELDKNDLINSNIKDIQKLIINEVKDLKTQKKADLIEQKEAIIDENNQYRNLITNEIKNEYINKNQEEVKNKTEQEILSLAIAERKQQLRDNFTKIKTDLQSESTNIKNSDEEYGENVKSYPIYEEDVKTDSNTIEEEIINKELKATNRVIVLFKNKADKRAVEQSGGKVNREFSNVPAIAATMPETAIKGLKNNPNIQIVENDVQVKTAVQTQDWGITRLDAPTAWSTGLTGKGVKVAVIDTGIAKHEDLVIAGGVAFTAYTTSYHDDNGHGTHVAGIIGARNNLIGTVGIAPESSIYAVKSLDSTGSGYLSDIIAGIDWSINNKMDIINLSLGTTTSSLTLQQVVDKAYAQNIAIVAAAGNSGNAEGTGDNVLYPARYTSVIAVSATDSNNLRASFSSTGDTVEVSAPGVNVLSTFIDNKYAKLNGTSMASPYVAGNIALLKQLFPTSLVNDLRLKLRTKIIDLGQTGKDTWFGYGLIQAPKNEQITQPEPSEPIVDIPPTVILNTTTSVSTNKTSYLAREKVEIKAIVKDANNKLLSGVNVDLTLTIPDGTKFTSKSLTNTTGEVTFTYSTRGNSPQGTYNISVVSTATGFNSSSGTTNFEVVKKISR